jgi:hypothetical protein
MTSFPAVGGYFGAVRVQRLKLWVLWSSQPCVRPQGAGACLLYWGSSTVGDSCFEGSVAVRFGRWRNWVRGRGIASEGVEALRLWIGKHCDSSSARPDRRKLLPSSRPSATETCNNITAWP